MKNLLYILLLSFLPIVGFSTANINVLDPISIVEQDVTSQITSAISKGDATGVAKFFDSSVDVNILGDNGTYSKSQAEQMLKSFFTKNKVSSFKVIHNVNSPSGSSSSFVGQLNSNGKNYRLFVLMSDSGSSKIIQEITIKER